MFRSRSQNAGRKDEPVADRDQELRDSRKKRLIPWMLMDIISEKIYHFVTRDIKSSEFESLIERIHRREIDPYTVADEIVEKLKKSR